MGNSFFYAESKQVHTNTRPQVVEVSKDETQAAVVHSPLVNLIRAKLKEKHVNQGSYIFRWVPECSTFTQTLA
mgnify:CR=1 FL=1